jgi:hypothetical protein
LIQLGTPFLIRDSISGATAPVGFKVHIYQNGVEIKGSPFVSYTKGGQAIGLNSVSSIRN